MSEEEIYERLRDWLKQTWYDLPETEELLPTLPQLGQKLARKDRREDRDRYL